MITSADVGKRVVCVWDGTNHGRFNPLNKKGRVTAAVDNYTVTVQFDDEAFNEHFPTSHWLMSSFKVIHDNLDCSRPLRCRGEHHKVKLYTFHSDRVSACIVLPDGRELSMDYQLDGSFYLGFEQPIDLVNA